jgi:cobalt/nickel transport system permease protein
VFYLVRRVRPRGHSSYLASLAAASWVSIVVASIAASLELAVSGVVPLGIALPAMSSVHMIIGLGEALITTVVVAAVYATRPDLVTGLRPRLADIPDAPGGTRPRTSRRMRVWAFAASALVVAVALAVFVSPFASSSPDGLEKVASDKGFESAAAAQPVWGHSPLPDYTLPGIGSAKVSTAVAGLVGTVLIFALVLVLGRTFARRGLRTADNPDSA